MNVFDQLTNFVLVLMLLLVLLGTIILAFFALGYLAIIWYRNRERERNSLDSTLLQIALPRDNEISIFLLVSVLLP